MISKDPIDNAIHLEDEQWSIHDLETAMVGAVADWMKSRDWKTLDLNLTSYSLALAKAYARSRGVSCSKEK